MKHRINLLFACILTVISLSGCLKSTYYYPVSALYNGFDGPVMILTKDTTIYRFDDCKYIYSPDSLKRYISGFGTRYRHGITSTYGGNIPLTDIQAIIADRIDPTKSAITYVASAAMIIALGVGSGKAGAHPTVTHPYYGGGGGGGSCPFVYSFDGTQYQIDGEPYGGAVCKALQRLDWTRLEHLKSVDGQYRLRLTNEMDETQHNDELKLWYFDHLPGTDVMIDFNGKAYTVANLQKPLLAQDSHGNDLTKVLSENDEEKWQSDLLAKSADKPSDYRDTIFIYLPKPNDVTSAKLVVGASTTFNGQLALKSMLKLRGWETGFFFDALNKPANLKKFEEWNNREEFLYLHVNVWTGSKWERRGKIVGSGPFVPEQRVVTLDLTAITGDTLKIMLAPPAGFWTLNSFAIDYSQTPTPAYCELSAMSIIGDDGKDLRKELAETDGKYYSMKKINQSAEVTFAAPPLQSGYERTIYAKVSGYYDIHLRNFFQLPRTATINRIEREPGYPVRFALQQWSKWSKELAAKYR